MPANRFTLEMRGAREAKQAFVSLVKAMDPATGSGEVRGLYRIAQEDIRSAIAAAGQFLRDKARSNAAVTGSPRRLSQGSKPAIFSFADFNAASDDKRKRSVLVGVRTGLASRAKDPRLFIQWGSGAKRRKDGSTAHRGLSMSFGALFERGTANGRVRARHYFANAVTTTQGQIKVAIGNAYRRAVEILNRNTGN